MRSKVILYIVALLVLAPSVQAFELASDVIVKPNQAAGGYYTINNTIDFDNMTINGTDVWFQGLDTNNRTVYTQKTNGDFIEFICENTVNCVVPQTSDNRDLRFTIGINFTIDTWSLSSQVGSYSQTLELQGLTATTATNCNMTLNSPTLGVDASFNDSSFSITNAVNVTILASMGGGIVGTETANFTVDCAETTEYVNGTITLTAPTPAGSGSGSGGGFYPICGNYLCQRYEDEKGSIHYCPSDCYIINVSPSEVDITIMEGRAELIEIFVNNTGRQLAITPAVNGSEEAIGWVTINPAEATLPMNTIQKFNVIITVPYDADITSYDLELNFNNTVDIKLNVEKFSFDLVPFVTNAYERVKYSVGIEDDNYMRALVLISVALVSAIVIMIARGRKKKVRIHEER